MRPLIDIHGHLFNTRYWPVKGIVKYAEVPLPRTLSVIAEAIVRTTPDDECLDEDIRPLSAFLHRAWHRLEDKLPDPLDLDGLIDEKLAAKLVSELLPDDLVLDATPEIDELIEGYAPEALAASAREAAVKPGEALTLLEDFDGDMPEKLLNIFGARVAARRLAIDAALRKLFTPEDGPPDHRDRVVSHLVRFLLIARRSEIGITNNYFRQVPGCKLLVHHLMDLDVPYKDDSSYHYKKQVKRLRKLGSLYPGRVLGFVAYDPYRGNLDLVKQALTSGYAGIKIYPPTGYRPIGNATPAVSAVTQWVNDIDGATIESRLTALYEHALTHDVPLMAHCNPSGFERGRKHHVPIYGHEDETVEGTGNLGDPHAYDDLLSLQHPTLDFSKLRLCLGHAGGHDWAKTPLTFDPEHPKITTACTFCHAVYLLCRRYENVYCDFGHLIEVMNADLVPQFIRNMIRLGTYEKTTALNPYPFFKKILFGTDYFMPNDYGPYGDYTQQFIHIFDESELATAHPGLADDFFINNAKAFLDLKGYLERNPGLPDEEKAAYTKLADEG